MTTTTNALLRFSPALLLVGGLVAACTLDSSEKNECETKEDCLGSLVCSPTNTCENPELITPTILASGQDRPTGITTDGTAVYWATLGGDVMKVDKSGGTPATMASEQTGALAIAVDSASVYWTTVFGTRSIMKVPLSGGAPTVIATGENPYGLAVTTDTIYWSDFGSDAGSVDGAIMKAPLSGGSATTLASGERGPLGIAVDATNVYWARNDISSQIMKVAIGGGNVAPVTAGQDHPAGVAVFESNVFWTNYSNPPYNTEGKVMKASLVDGTPIELATDQLGPLNIVTDGSYVYWTNQGDKDMEASPSRIPNTGSVMRAAADGSSLSTIADGQNGPHSIAIDATHVYWTNEDDGTVLSFAKSDIL